MHRAIMSLAARKNVCDAHKTRCTLLMKGAGPPTTLQAVSVVSCLGAAAVL